jgi:hypothetical protein
LKKTSSIFVALALLLSGCSGFSKSDDTQVIRESATSKTPTTQTVVPSPAPHALAPKVDPNMPVVEPKQGQPAPSPAVPASRG